METNLNTLKFFAEFIHDQCGILYSPDNYYQLESRLEQIAKQMDLLSIEQLYKQILSVGMTSKLSALLIDSATNNETSFFRDARVFVAIEQLIVPMLYRLDPQRPLRIWSAASSTGQEIYSIAMLLRRLASSLPNLQYELVATDLSERVLSRARAGRYQELEINRGLDAAAINTFFDRCSDQGDGCTYEVKPILKEKIRFDSLNLISAWPSWVGVFDLILCRNVLIYQTVEQKEKVIANLRNHMHPQGFLFLGGAESLIGLASDFEQVQMEGAICYKFATNPP